MSKVKIKWDQKAEPKFVEQLSNIKTTLVAAPTQQEVESYIPEFVHATWEDTPKTSYSQEETEETMKDLFNGKLLPTALETIRLTFRVEGLDLIDVTHLIRHRVFGFSAQCSADRDMRTDTVMVKPSILNSMEFIERYRKLHEDAFELYADMVDSKDISILDARTVLPRSTSSFYYMSGSLKDFIGFIKTRKDRQIQPESDNIVALRMWHEIVKQYPMLKGHIDINGYDAYYCETLVAGTSSNTYLPNDKNIEYLNIRHPKFEYTDEEYLYNRRRHEMSGGRVYRRIEKEIRDGINCI